MIKNWTILLLTLFCLSTINAQESEEKKAISEVLNSWHKAAADANFKVYFEKMTPNGIFIGTDATENWTIDEFKAFAKPYFDRGSTWNFTAIDRNIFLDASSKNIAWFDELLNTQMELCRGSGVMKKVNGEWKIAHYVLSMAIPNENITEIVAIKKERDSIIKSGLLKH
ncbi:hypothetical protein GTQ40_13070 [Flavobacteriaceae bacterium R38]|nr:hypothetical protein [Flavobacteriaceae bacterium R38]